MRLPLLLAAAPLAGLTACGPAPADAPAAPRSLVLVTIDTLRADRVGCYGHEGARTPTLDGLAARGVRCARTSAVAPLTFPAHTSLMTGLLPPAHGARDNGSHRAVPGLETLAETLRARGFRTGGFTAAFVLDSIYGLDQGFEVYGDVPQRQAEPTAEFEERPAAEVNAEALAWLDSVARDERFFLWVHYFEPHQPYPPAGALPPEFRGRPYDAEVAAADRALGELLDGLEARGRLAESLVVVTSDHGESLGEHGEATHSLFVYEGVLHVPLVFAHAGLPAGGVLEAPTSTVDVRPTVLELLGVDAPLPAPPATSLVEALRGAELPPRPVYFESLYARLNYGWAELQGVREGDLKLIRAPRPELYDLRGDRAEAENLHAARPDEARRLAGELEAVLDAARAAAPEGDARRELSGEERRRLANLGYTGTAAAGEVEVTLMDPKDGVGRMQRELEVRELMDAGREAEARAVIETLLVEEPGNPVLNTHMGLAWMRSGSHAEAIPFFERALAGGFENATTRSNLGVCLHFTGDHEGARDQLGRALEENPKHLLSLWWLAQDQLATGEREAARASLERILELWGGAPDDATSRQVRAQLEELGG
jgi:choline-sulfatase